MITINLFMFRGKNGVSVTGQYVWINISACTFPCLLLVVFEYSQTT